VLKKLAPWKKESQSLVDGRRLRKRAKTQ